MYSAVLILQSTTVDVTVPALPPREAAAQGAGGSVPAAATGGIPRPEQALAVASKNGSAVPQHREPRKRVRGDDPSLAAMPPPPLRPCPSELGAPKLGE